MKGQGTDRDITIKMAAEALGVSTKSIQRYLKKGLLTKLKFGTRTYVPLAEIEALSAGTIKGQGQIASRRMKERSHKPGDTVTLHRERYESLLIELGELRKQSQFLDEFRTALSVKEEEVRSKDRDMQSLRDMIGKMEIRDQEKSNELEKSAQRIHELEAELESFRSQKPWWQK